MISEKKAAESAIQKAIQPLENIANSLDGEYPHTASIIRESILNILSLYSNGEFVRKSELKEKISVERYRCQSVVNSVSFTRSEKSEAMESIYWLNTFESWLSHGDDAKAVKQE